MGQLSRYELALQNAKFVRDGPLLHHGTFCLIMIILGIISNNEKFDSCLFTFLNKL